MRGATSAFGWLGGWAIALFVIVVVVGPVGGAIHAGGHVAASLAVGGDVARVNVLGLQLWPHLAWHPERSSYGRVERRGSLATTQSAIIEVAGSGTTWLVSLLAALGYGLRRRWRSRVLRAAHTGAVLLLLDVLVHSLGKLGVPTWKLFGLSRQAHPSGELVAGAATLGVPPVATLALVFAWPLLAWWLLSRQRAKVIRGGHR